MHDTLSWTACYDDNCFVHMSSRDGAGWWPQKPRKRHNDYNSTDCATTSESKGLAILEKDEIEETDTRGTQEKEGTAEAYDWNDDLTLTYLDSDADPEDVDYWEADMGLKNQYEHPENVHTEMRRQVLEGRRLDLEREITAVEKERSEAGKTSLNS